MSNEVVVDLTNYKDKTGSRVAPGRYKVIVDDLEQSQARSGNAMIVLWFRVLDGEFSGSTVLDRLVLTENSMFRVVGFMQAVGIPTPKKRLKINLKQFLGKVLEIDVEDGEPYNGRVKSEVRGYMRITGQAAETESVEDPLAGLADDTADEPTPTEIDLDTVEL
mgnify:CR=1 FL=1